MHGRPHNGKKISTSKKIYGEDEVLLFDGTFCGFKQVVLSFWKQFLKAHEEMGNSWSSSDPYLYINWIHDGLTVC